MFKKKRELIAMLAGTFIQELKFLWSIKFDWFGFRQKAKADGIWNWSTGMKFVTVVYKCNLAFMVARKGKDGFINVPVFGIRINNINKGFILNFT